MSVTRRLRRTLAAATTALALVAGSALIATPAAAATEYRQGDRVVGPLIEYANTVYLLVNNPVAADVVVESNFTLADWNRMTGVKARWSRPAPGTTGPIILENIGQCLDATTNVLKITGCVPGSVSQMFKANAAPLGNSYDIGVGSVSYTLTVAKGVGSGAISPYTLGLAKAIGGGFRVEGVVTEVLAEDDLVVTSPVSGASVPMNAATFTGKATRNARVQITDSSGGSVGSATADASGAWSTTLRLPEGPVTLNFSSGTKTASWSGVATNQAAKLVVTSPKNGDKVGTKGVVFTGTGEPGETVEVRTAHGVLLGSASIWKNNTPINGTWSITLDLPSIATNVPAGAVTLNFATATGSAQWSGIATVPSGTMLQVLLPELDSVVSASGAQFVVSANRNSRVNVYDADGKSVGSFVATNDGIWSGNLSLPEGPAYLKFTSGAERA